LSIPASLLAAPPDDVGAQTADRYDWQALVAAVDCIAAMTECASKSSTGGSTEVWVICEHHEDFVLSVGGSVQLVSVKHREPGLGGWTRASLFAAGGVAHLFSRWLDLQELVSVRVATNAGLSNDLGPSPVFVVACGMTPQVSSRSRRSEISTMLPSASSTQLMRTSWPSSVGSKATDPPQSSSLTVCVGF